MKMTPLSWRLVSLLCVVLVCRSPSCYVGCTESHQETQRPVSSSQDVSVEEESRESHQHKVEESLALPTPSLSEHELLPEDELQKQEHTTPEEDKKHHYSEVKAFQLDESSVDLETDVGIAHPDPEPDQGSEIPDLEVSVTQDQESAPLTAPSDLISSFAAEEDIDSPSTLQDNIPHRVSHDAADVAPHVVVDSDLPTDECEEDTNPYDDERSLPIVLENTSNAHASGTKTLSDPSVSSPAGQYLEPNASHMLKDQDLSSPAATDTDSSVSSKDPEDIPTFDEWKRKMMEVEKEKTLSTHTSNNGAPHVVKKVQKNFNNYASVECGAKILGANPEAKSTSSILKENMDLYMLNPCSNKIWFIIELCEPIQVKQLDIANFELFSSTPKDFLVSISDRYPTNKWLKLGTFHARDERTVQSFPLDEHLYAKYVKVELVSHFGSEHFCPLSLIRVFGTSMVEEYEEISDPSERPDEQEDDLDDLPGYTPGEAKYPKNLIGSAKDVILNMVNNIAVNVLGGGPEMQGNISSQVVNTTEPSPQHETPPQTTRTDPPPVPDSDEARREIPEDVDIPEPGAPSSEAVVPEAPPPGTVEQEPPSAEDNIIIPLENDEEEPIGSTIILLDREEELEEEKKDSDEQQEAKLDYCALHPSFSSSCCTASLQEYIQRQSSVLLFKQRKSQIKNRKQMIPSIQTPAWHLPLPPSACPEPRLHHSEVHQPHEKEQASEPEPVSGASPSVAQQPPAPTIESHEESMSEPPLLEPSQTSNLPEPSATDSSPANPSPVVETPQLSSEEPVKPLWPEQSQDVLDREQHMEAAVPLSSSAVDVKPSSTMEDATVAPTEKHADASQSEINTFFQNPETTDRPHILHSSAAPQLEQPPSAALESVTTATEPPKPTEPEPSGGQTILTETKMEDLSEDVAASLGGSSQLPRPSTPGPPSLLSSPSLSDIYAEAPNGTEQNGNMVHGSSQKESVFMRLNNRIKALEMNMSLSGRYLEQLSQRYRKQMEEMQKAFNITVIKLQNTSRIAEEQDQRQTDSIQLLQGQLENVTQLVLNLSVRVSQLESEVSDRHNYLLLSLMLCVCFVVLLFVNRCRISIMPPSAGSEPPVPKSYTYCCPERRSSSCDDAGLKRSASYPLIHSESFQLVATKDPEILHAEETQSLCPANRKKRRRKMKPFENVTALPPSCHAAPQLCNGAVLCNGAPVTAKPAGLSKRLLQPTCRDSPSEGSSECSSHSDDPSFCGITTACSRICDGFPPPRTRVDKRVLRRRRPKPVCAAVDFLQAPRRDQSESLPISTIEDIMNRKTEPSSETFGLNVPLSGPV